MSPKEYKNTVLWDIVARWINELEDYGDIRLTNNEDVVIGYICQQMDKDLMTPGSVAKCRK